MFVWEWEEIQGMLWKELGAGMEPIHFLYFLSAHEFPRFYVVALAS